MSDQNRKRGDGPQDGRWISKEDQRSMHLETRPENEGDGAHSEASRQQGWSPDAREDQQQGRLLGDEDESADGYRQGEERPGREMQERQHLERRNEFEDQLEADADRSEDLSTTPEDDRRKVRAQQDRIRQQGDPRTPEERLGSGWADPEDPSQAMYEDTINEDEENLADKRT